MSLQGLISGAECATQSNPLSQVLKHTEGDRSLQQVQPRSPWDAQSLKYLFRTELPVLRALGCVYASTASGQTMLIRKDSFTIYPERLSQTNMTLLLPVSSSTGTRKDRRNPRSPTHRFLIYLPRIYFECMMLPHADQT